MKLFHRKISFVYGNRFKKTLWKLVCRVNFIRTLNAICDIFIHADLIENIVTQCIIVHAVGDEIARSIFELLEGFIQIK